MCLVHATSKEQVNKILEDEFFKNVKWSPFGQREGNYSDITNQQNDPINAICEKPVNSTDAMLIKECKKSGIDPEGPNAPKSMVEAVGKFFNIPEGDITKISEERKQELANHIMLIADGSREKPSITVVDRGEGQDPKDFEKTLLSLDKSNKNRIPFVQGKYNRGGTGVIPFCGGGYQLILSRKSIELAGENSEWGFTLVREKPDFDTSYKVTWYEYFLTPDNEIFRLPPRALKILPGERDLVDGTFIKMYSYDLPNPSLIITHFYEDMNRKLFAPALPMRIIENRKSVFSIKEGHDNVVLVGNKFRTLKNKNVYKKISIESTLEGFGTNTIEVTIFRHATRVDGTNPARSFIKPEEAVFFTQNGQTHFHMGRSPLRTKTNLPHLADYMMVHLDLTNISRNKSKIFMASRDRIRKTQDYRDLEERLFADIREDEQIKAIHEEYRLLDLQSIAQDSKINEAISGIFKNNPELIEILNQGNSLTRPEKKGQLIKQPFDGRYYPTFLKVYGYFGPGDCTRGIPTNGEAATIVFRTDAANDYLTREIDKGELILKYPEGLLVTKYELFNGRIPVKLIASSNAIAGDVPGKFTITLTRPNDNLVCNVNLYYYIPQKTDASRHHKERKISGVKFPEPDPVISKRWGEFGWSEEDIARVDDDVIHVNIECKPITDYLKTKPSIHKENIVTMFVVAMYFHALILHKELRDEMDYYDKSFKKCMSATAKATLPVLYEKNIESVLELFKTATTKAMSEGGMIQA